MDRIQRVAKSYPARDLKLLIKGIELLQKTKTMLPSLSMLLSLSLNDHKLLSAALLKHGALPSGNGHANKETALMKMVAKLILYEKL